MARSMFDPRMMDRLSAFFPSVVDIQESVIDTDELGSPAYSWTAVEGLEGIPCAVAPFNDIIPISGERKFENYSYDTTTRRITLKGYYPQITPKMMALVEDHQYNILGVELDSHHVMTRIIVNDVTI